MDCLLVFKLSTDLDANLKNVTYETWANILAEYNDEMVDATCAAVEVWKKYSSIPKFLTNKMNCQINKYLGIGKKLSLVKFQKILIFIANFKSQIKKKKFCIPIEPIHFIVNAILI